jgi:hypothetical protein
LRSALALSFAVVLAGVLQTSLGMGGKYGPDLLLLVAMISGWLKGPEAGALVGLACGIFTGTLHGNGIGGFLVSRIAAALGVSWMRQQVYGERPFILAACCLLGTGLAAGLLMLWQPPREGFDWLPLLIQAVVNAALSLVAHPILRFLAGKPYGEESSL